MRRLFLSVLTALLVASLAGPAMAHPTSSLGPTLPVDATFAATDNIDYHGRFPEHASTAGGMRHGDFYYVTDGRGVSVYDVAGDATSPELVGQLPLLQVGTGLALSQEDVNTDGHVLIVDGAPQGSTASDLRIVDVSDPANMSVIGTVDVTDHTWTCVTGRIDTGELRGCAYAFGRSGHIIDLTDPTNPTNLGGTWRQLVGYGTRSNDPYTHDLTEIKPGLVMSAGSTMILMDTSSLLEDAANPAGIREITRVDEAIHGHAFSSLGYHSMEWHIDADGGLADYLVAGTEIAPSNAGSDCADDEAVIETFDTSAVAAAHADWEAGDITFAELKDRATITPIDTFDAAGRGLYVDGYAPGHVLYCAHWMELGPATDNGGRWMATSYYDRGTRFVEIKPDGTFDDEAAWMVPVQGYSGSVQWVTDEVLFIHDYLRGLEVISFTGTDATGTWEQADAAMALTSNFTPAAEPFHPENLATGSLLLLGLGMGAIELRRRQRLAEARARARV